MDVRVRGTERTTIGGDCHQLVGGGSREKVHKDQETKVEGDVKADVEGKYHLNVGKDYILWCKTVQSVGDDDYTISSTKTVSIQGADLIELSSGGSFIRLSKDKIIIESPQVLINCGGSAIGVNLTDPAKPDDPAGADDSKSGFPSNK
jgi:hypothetical protein